MSELEGKLSELDWQRTEAILRYLLQNETITSSQAAALLMFSKRPHRVFSTKGKTLESCRVTIRPEERVQSH